MYLFGKFTSILHREILKICSHFTQDFEAQNLFKNPLKNEEERKVSERSPLEVIS